MLGNFGWRLPSFYRFEVLVTFGVVAVVGIVVVAAPGPARPSLSFALLWTAGLAWNAYWFLLRIVHRLEVADGVLSWRAPLRSGQVPIADVVAIRPSSVAGHVVITRHGKILVAFSTLGFEEFGAALQALQPSMSVVVGRLSPARAPRRWRDSSGFYRFG